MINKCFVKFIASISTISMTLGLFVFSAETSTEEKAFYVSCDGSDTADGSQSNPFKTIERAKEEVRKYNKDMQGDIVVNIQQGTYYQTESLDFTEEDSGYNGHSVIYHGINTPVISGGITVSGFAKSDRKYGVYELSLPEFKENGIYQMYNANGGRRQLAKIDHWIVPQGDYDDLNTEYTYDGILFNTDDIPELCNVGESEVVWYRGWTVTKFHPESIVNADDKMAVKFKNPEWNYYRIANENGVTSASKQVVCYLQNDFSLLDSPGEFYYDKDWGKLYYLPLEFENMDEEKFIIPTLETFAFFMGSKTAENEADSVKVRNITFEGITFSHFACDKSYDDHFVSGQGPAYSGRKKATYSNDNGAFYLNRADNINFYDNCFTEMVQTPINLRNDVSNCNIKNNKFYNLSSSAIDIGETAHIERTIKDDVNYVIKKLPKTDYNMMLLNPYISASNIYNDDGSNNFSCLTIMPSNTNADFYPDESFDHTSVQSLENYKYYANPNTWKDKNGWIKFDFSREYTFSEIALAFDPDQISADDRAKFEVLLSNDENFAEGNYIKVGESENYGEIVDFKPTGTEKYRYLLVRAVEDKEFAVTNVYAFTPDLPHQIVRRGCKNINIENNYIDNVCTDEFSQAAIFVYYCDELNISHNEISNLPYTGISYGLSWGAYGLCGKGNITNNYIHDVTQILYDGGAIYTLGNHEGSMISDNYVRNAAGGVGLYFDNGSCGITAENNVEEFSRATVTYNSGSKNCTLRNMYTTSSNIEVSSESQNTVSDAVIYNLYDENDTVRSIKANAGLKTSINSNRQNGVYNSLSYDLKMGLGSNCSIVTYRMPKFYNAIKNALQNTAESESLPQYVKNVIIKFCNNYNQASADNIIPLLGLAKNIDKYVNALGSGSVKYVESDEVTDFEIDDKNKIITVYTDSTEGFELSIVCDIGTVNIGTVFCEKEYKLDMASADETWKVVVKNAVEINIDNDEKISNIGKKPLLKIDFHYLGGTEKLNEGNIIIKRIDSEKPIKVNAYNITDRAYLIDNSTFTSYIPDKNGNILTDKLLDYDVNIAIKNVYSNTGRAIGNMNFTRTVDKNTLPLEYIEGKIIKNIAKGTLPDGVCSTVAEHLNLTDENGVTYDRYSYKKRLNQDQDGYCFRIDFGAWYDVAAAVVESANDRDYTWDNNNSQFGLCADKTDFLNETDIVFNINNKGIKSGQRIGVIFNKNNLRRYRYFLGGPDDMRNITYGELLLGDVCIYAYTDENGSAASSKDFDFSKYKIAHSDTSVWGEATSNGENEISIILAMYKNGALVCTKKVSGKGCLKTAEIEVPGEWTEFPKKSDGFEVKLFAFSGFDTIIPYTEPETNVMTQISCWGDSYTYEWPEKLQALIGDKAEVHNFGISTNTAADIAGRQGGVPIVLKDNVTLNNNTPVNVQLKSSGGEEQYSLNLYDKLNNFSSSINPCTLNGVTGVLSYQDGDYYFSDYGDINVELEQGTRLITNQEKTHNNDIHIIMTGTNGGFGKCVEEWVMLEQKMVNNIGGNRKKYIVMSLPSNTFKNTYTNKSNDYRKTAFEDNFLNLYEKFTDIECLQKYGVTLSDEDIAEMNNGSLPPSLLNEKGVFLNSKGFDLIAQIVYDKLIDLGYISY